MDTDFGRAAALLSEGSCPLCRVPISVSWCPGCRVGWNLSTIDGKPAIGADRPLTEDEIRRLYDHTD